MTMDINIAELIKEPNKLNRETLLKLKLLVARYPFYHTARLLYLKNLYTLEDPLFEQVIRKDSFFIADRNIIFSFISKDSIPINRIKVSEKRSNNSLDRTESLINKFLGNNSQCAKKQLRYPIDASKDYVYYMLHEEEQKDNGVECTNLEENKNSKEGDLIDKFIENNSKKIELKDNPEYSPEVDMRTDGDTKDSDEDYFTEVLAKIYIQQGRYLKAIEILNKVNLLYPKKNSYFADQIRFLKKLVINENNKK